MSLPNNVSPEMMQMVQQAMMSNPQVAAKIQQIMMKPGAQEKLSRLMQNPMLMSDPTFAGDADMQELVQIMQQLMGGGNAGFPNVPAPSPAGNRPAAGSIEHIKTLEQFGTLLMRAGSKLVVVDFHATWCGPCKAIAPYFEKLAKDKAAVAVFAKVDVDQAKTVAQRKGVSSMPTFQFYKNGRKIDEMKGANAQLLTSKINLHSKPNAKPKAHPCANYPVKERFSFPKVKISKMKEKLEALNEELEEKSGKLEEKQSEGLSKLLAVLEKTSNWHNSKLEALGILAVVHMIKKWSDANLIFVMDLLRITLLHPDAGRIVKFPNLLSTMFERVKEKEKNDKEGMLVLRGLSNLLSRKQTRLAFLAWMEEEGDDFLLDTLNELLASEKVNTRQAYLKFVMNLCYGFVEKEGEDPEDSFDMARSYIFLALAEQLKAEKDAKVMLNLLITIQCVLFKCKSVKEWTGDEGVASDLGEHLEKAKGLFKDDENISLCVSNIKTIISE